MERLRFTYSLDINSQLIERESIENKFFIFHGQITADWKLYIDRNESSEQPNRLGITRFSLIPYDYKLSVNARECSCKFILKRKGFPELECVITGQEGSNGPVFDMPRTNAIFKFFERFFETPTEMKAVLVIVLEFPKKPFFANNWSPEVRMAPVGWESDKRYKFLTVEDKHDFHIICTDGIFLSKKRYFTRNSDFFRKKFESEWKTVSEIELDISLETMKVIGTYVSTKTFLGPKEIKRETFQEILAIIEKFDLLPLLKSLEAYMYQSFSEKSLSFSELFSWWEAAGGHLRDIIIPTLAKNYYSEIVTNYKPDATFEDKEKAKIHKVLHQELIYSCIKEEQTLYRLIVRFYKMSQKVTVSEVTMNN